MSDLWDNVAGSRSPVAERDYYTPVAGGESPVIIPDATPGLRTITLTVPNNGGVEPDYFVRLSDGSYIPTWGAIRGSAQDSEDVKKSPWHSGKKVHAVSILSSIVAVAAIAGYVPGMTANDGWDMLQAAGIASGFREAIKSPISAIIDLLRGR